MTSGPVMRRPPPAGRTATAVASELHYPGFLGRGWAFPPTFNHPAAHVVLAAGDVDIRQSLWILLSTGLGERLMLAPYGCDLWSEVFTALTPTTANAIANMVTNAIIEWEPRVTVENVIVTASQDGSGWLNISIDYRVIQTNSRSNLVYPFYTREATLLAPVG
jgi:phage baseplate assembly protein W